MASFPLNLLVDMVVGGADSVMCRHGKNQLSESNVFANFNFMKPKCTRFPVYRVLIVKVKDPSKFG